MGAAMNSNYYHGPYGWGGYGMAYGGFYGSGYDDVLDHREDMMEDLYDHREDMQENRKEMAEDREGKTVVNDSRHASNRPGTAGRRDQNNAARQRASAKPIASQERHRPLPIVRPAASRVGRVPVRKTWGLVLLLAALAFLRSLRVMIRAGMDRALLKRRASAPARAPEACPGTNGVALLRAPVRAGEAVWAVVVGGDALVAVAAGVAASARIPHALSVISRLTEWENTMSHFIFQKSAHAACRSWAPDRCGGCVCAERHSGADTETVCDR